MGVFMKTKLSVIIFLILSNILLTSIIINATETKKDVIAIMDFEIIDVKKEYVDNMMMFIEDKIVNTKLFVVAERQQISKIIKEFEVQSSDLFNSRTAQKIGKVLGANKALIGKLKYSMGIYYLQLKIVDVETASITASVIKNTPDITKLKQLCENGIDSLVDSLPVPKKTDKTKNKKSPIKSQTSSDDSKTDSASSMPNSSIQKSSWYIGFGFGYGNGDWTFDDDRNISYSETFEDTESAIRIGFYFGVGLILIPKIHVGALISGIRETGSVEYNDADISMFQMNIFVICKYFPFEKGIFAKAGGGLAIISASVDYGGIERVEDAVGLGFMFGGGYALKLGETFNLTFNLDINIHGYFENDNHWKSGKFWLAYIGFEWF